MNDERARGGARLGDRGAEPNAPLYETLLVAVLLFLPGILLFAASYLPSLRHHSPWANIFQDLGIVFIVSGSIGGVVQAFVLRFRRQFEHEAVKFLREQVEKQLQRISHDIERQTARFHHDVEKQTMRSVAAVSSAVSSLAAMRESAVSKVYPCRMRAAADMARDLRDPEVHQIQLIAVSLNNFVRGLEDLAEAWRQLEDLIQGKRPLPNKGGRLDVKVLIIDPYCLGAQLRSRGESRVSAAIAGRLQTEAKETAEHLLSLKQNAPSADETGISFDFRLYRTVPIFFLFRTNLTAYLQPYYFWSSRHFQTETPDPVLCFKGAPEPPWESAFQDQMNDHFQWIWTHAAVTAEEVLDERQYGLDRGLHGVSAINVYNDPEEGRQRILSILAGARKRVFIQGISLDSFFDQGNPLFDSIAKLAESGEVELKCLILDPESDQARYRAYREHLIAGREVSFADFAADEDLYRKSQLYRDTQATLENVRVVLAPRTRTNQCFQIRLYDSAPACFMLLVDDRVLVEQYHYGKTSEGTQRFPVILGKQMPLVEYGRQDDDLYEHDQLRSPARLLEDHFLFVFNRCSRLPDEFAP